MKCFIWAEGLPNGSYHEDGSAIVIAQDLEAARQLLEERENNCDFAMLHSDSPNSSKCNHPGECPLPGPHYLTAHDPEVGKSCSHNPYHYSVAARKTKPTIDFEVVDTTPRIVKLLAGCDC